MRSTSNKMPWLSWSDTHKPRHGRLHYGHGKDETVVRGRLALAGIALCVVCVAGTVGYFAIGKGQWSWEDCAYMVLITITTVGYAEVLPIAQAEGGRLFSMALLVSGIGVSVYFLSALTAFIVEGDLGEVLWRRKMHKRLSKLRNHHIVCGAGRTGRHVVEELLRAGCQVVVVEKEQKRISRLNADHGDGLLGILGDATEDGVLRDAGIEHATGLVTALELDQDNLFVALSARQLRPTLRIVSRSNSDRSVSKLRQAGADSVISPTHIGGRRMAHELLRPNVVGFLDFIARDVERNLGIEEVPIGTGSPLVGVQLSKSKIREVSSALVLAVLKGGTQTYNPPPDFEFEEGMTLIVLGEREQLERLNRHVAGNDA